MASRTHSFGSEVMLGDSTNLKPGDPRWNVLLYFDKTHVYLPCDDAQLEKYMALAMGGFDNVERPELLELGQSYSRWVTEAETLVEAGVIQTTPACADDRLAETRNATGVRQFLHDALSCVKDGEVDVWNTEFASPAEAATAATGWLLAQEGYRAEIFDSDDGFAWQLRFMLLRDIGKHTDGGALMGGCFFNGFSAWYTKTYGVPSIECRSSKRKTSGTGATEYDLFSAGLGEAATRFCIQDASQLLAVRDRCSDSLSALRVKLGELASRLSRSEATPEDVVRRFVTEELRPSLADFKNQAKSLPERLLRAILPDSEKIASGLLGLVASTHVADATLKAATMLGPLAAAGISRYVLDVLADQKKTKSFPYRFYLDENLDP